MGEGVPNRSKGTPEKKKKRLELYSKINPIMKVLEHQAKEFSL